MEQHQRGTLEIRFPAYTSGAPPRCTPRTNLAGVVYLQLPKAQAATCVQLSFTGAERISLAPSSVNSNTAHMPMVRSKTVRREYFSRTMALWTSNGEKEPTEAGQLAEGIHMFHFSCEFPRVNYPQTSTTEEYEITYVFKADFVNNSRPLLSSSQTINFIPETIALLSGEQSHLNAETPEGGKPRYLFSDTVHDTEDLNHRVFHLQAMGLQQAFVPGDMVDFQLRLTGGKQLRRAQYVLYEQTDCFYPQIPEPHEEQLDLGRRLWTSRKPLGDKRDLSFERDAYESHGAYYAHLHAQLPCDLFVLHESAYLRFTYYVELTVFSTSGWSSHIRRAQVRVPIPVASRVLLPETQMPRPVLLGRSPSVQSRGSNASSAKTDVDYPFAGGDKSKQGVYEGADPPSSFSASSSRLNRSITDLGSRLQQFIPRRLPSSPLNHRNNRTPKSRANPEARSALRVNNDELLGKASSLRAVSHCTRISDYAAPSWELSLVGCPPVPPLPLSKPSGLKNIRQGPQGVSIASPLSSTTSLVDKSVPRPSYGYEINVQPKGTTALRNQQLGRFFHAPVLHAMSTNGYKGGFSTTFLTRLHDLYHVDAHRAALAQLLEGSECSVVIPNAIIRSEPKGTTANRDRALGLFFDSQRVPEKTEGSKRRHNRRSDRASAGTQKHTDQLLWPRLVLVMTTYRNPWSSQISTWSAIGSSTSLHVPMISSAGSVVPRPHVNNHDRSLARTSVNDPCVGSQDLAPSIKASCAKQARYSRISAISVSSNDTACVSNGRLSLAKDITAVDSQHHHHHHHALFNDLVVSLDTVL